MGLRLPTLAADDTALSTREAVSIFPDCLGI